MALYKNTTSYLHVKIILIPRLRITQGDRRFFGVNLNIPHHSSEATISHLYVSHSCYRGVNNVGHIMIVYFSTWWLMSPLLIKVHSLQLWRIRETTTLDNRCLCRCRYCTRIHNLWIMFFIFHLSNCYVGEGGVTDGMFMNGINSERVQQPYNPPFFSLLS